MITKEEVQHIAKLARLGITPKEAEKFRADLSSILGYIENLKKIDVSKTEATSHPLLIKNVARKDEAEKKTQNLIELAPETKEGYIKVKSILK